MRLLFLFFLCLSSLLLGAQTVTVPETQQLLITKRTATWCTHCGTWGWTLFNNLREDNSEDAVLIAAHYSGNLQTPVALSLTDNFYAIGQPRFYVGDVDQNVSSGNIAQRRDEIRQQVVDSKDVAPAVQAGIVAGVQNDSLQVVVTAEFFTEQEGDFYLGIYLVRKEVLDVQTPQTGMVTHHNVLHSALTEEWQGISLGNGTLMAGTRQDFYTEVALGGDLTVDNLSIVTVIWRKEEGKYLFVNANQLTDIMDSPLVGVTNPYFTSQEVRLSVSPNPVQANSMLTVWTATMRPATRIDLLDASGRNLGLVSSTPLIAGEQYISLAILDRLPAGIYYIRLQSQGRQQQLSVVKP